MQSLVETLLQYSSLDEFNLKLRYENIDLREYIPKLLEKGHATDITVHTYIADSSVVISADPQYLAMQLNNVISNALQHAKSVVEVRVGPGKGNSQISPVIITVDDDGNGISDADRADVIKPFWQGENDAALKGHGMGLAIVARIADWLKAELVIGRSASLGGASISLVFKKI